MVVGLATKDSKFRCPECNSEKLVKFGKKWVKTSIGRIRVQQYQCQNCGRVTIKPLE